MKIGRLATVLGKGLLAGAAGTALMTVSSTIEMKARGRKPSDAPAEAASKVLGITPVGETEKKRFSTLVHFGYGTAWGVPRALYAAFGLSPVTASAAHFGSVWGAELVMLPKLDVAPPASEWGSKEVVIDAWHHAVYAFGTAAAYALLDHSQKRRRGLEIIGKRDGLLRAA